MDSFKKNDSFKKLVKSKLADYKHEVPPSGWDKLESSLFAMQKTKALHTRLIASSMAAAAILIGVIFLFQNINEELPTQTTDYQSTHTIEQKEPFVKKQNKTKTGKSTPPLLTDNISSSQHKRAISSSVQDKEIILEPSSDIPEDIKDSEVALASDEKPDSSNKSTEIDEREKQQLIQNFIDEGNRTLAVADDISEEKKRSRLSISLSGKSGLSSSQQTNTLPTTLRASVSDSYGTYTIGKMTAYNEDIEVKPESKKTHKQPVSFGILTSFNITRKLQIESGLIYTYLSSETRNKSSDFNNSEKVQFHYLGVPLNINYTLLSVNKMDLFVTAGAMIEKDIYGKIKYKDEKEIVPLKSGYAIESSSKIKQNNPQLSVATGVGINYPLYDNAKLFGKIGGRYYIDAKNEYKTYYSDEKLGLDIQLGIKFNF